MKIKDSPANYPIFGSGLAEFTEYVVTGDNLEKIFTRAVELITNTLPVEYVMAGELRSDGQKFILRPDADKSKAHKDDVNRSGHELRTTVLDLLARGAMVFDAHDKEMHRTVCDLVRTTNIACGISVPIPGRERPWGVLVAYSNRQRSFEDADANFISTVANILASTFERTWAEQKRRVEMWPVMQAKQEWESTVDNLPEIVCLFDRGGRVLRANRALEGWGIGRVVEVKGRKLHDLFHPRCAISGCDFKHMWSRAWRALGDEAIEWEVDDRVLGKNLRLSLKKISRLTGFKNEEAGSYALLVVGDLTDHRTTDWALRRYHHELEEKLKERTSQLVAANERIMKFINTDTADHDTAMDPERKYSFLMENILTGIYVRLQGEIVFCNQRFADIFKYRREQLIGLNFADLIYEEDLHILTGGLNLTPAYDVMPGGDVFRGITKDGDLVWIKSSVVDLENEGNRYIVGNVIDITEQKLVEKTLRDSEKELHLLSCQLFHVQENERKKIALELHDGVSQHLSAIKMNIESCVKSLDEKSLSEESNKLKISIHRIKESIDEVRNISMDLRPSILDDLGLLMTIEWFCRQYNSVYTNIEIRIRKKIHERDIPDMLKVIIYRIVQEALNNIAKHAKATTTSIEIRKLQGGIKLHIQDNGKGFNMDTYLRGQSGRSGLGIGSMRERTEAMGGSFVLKSNPGKGTTIEAFWIDKEVINLSKGRES